MKRKSLLILETARRWFALVAAVAAIFIVANGFAAAGEVDRHSVFSPNKRVKVNFYLTADGAPRYSLELDGKPVLLESKLGLVRADADFTGNLKLLSAAKIEPVADRYEILTAKRRLNNYLANRAVFRLQNARGQRFDVIFQVSDDGAAFRYFFPETNSKIYRLNDEVSSFRFASDAKAWLQPMTKARTGWKETQPSYEEYYQKEIPVGTPSTLGAGWVFPALFRSGETWVLLSETGVARNYCAARLSHNSSGGEYKIGFPDALENFQNGAVNPESKLPWLTPWRVIVVGSLKTIAESTLGVDLADKAAFAADGSQFEPGKSAWSWVLLGDGQTTFDTQKRFIDYAAAMRWRYCLIDALWDTQIGYTKIKELVDYARTKNVKILLWYNSAGDWNSSPQTPRNLLLTRAGRLREFERIKAIGVAGLKVDFFGGDGQSFMNYYQDILEDAAKYGFVMNFHGATLPRGWQRTFPNLMTMEAVRGFEFVTFEQANADQEAAHSAMLPFTRNVFDPMDFTPVALDRVNDRVQRRTTSAFELALAVLFTSGIQHYAETPEGMAKAPIYVQEFLKNVPSVWDDTKFLDGYPGKFAVLARQGANCWYVAGINGEAAERKITINLSELQTRGNGRLIIDGDAGNLSFREQKIDFAKDKKLDITVRPNGGFVIVAD